MSIYELLDEKSIKIGLRSTTKQAVLEELVDLLVSSGKVKDKYTVLDAIEEREKQASTGLENGIAVPHCKTAAVDKLTAALGVSASGIDFESHDGKPAKIFFILIAQPNNPGPHVRALAKLARLLTMPGMCEAILNAKTSAECLQLIKLKEMQD
jgi:fructose-specific phosphotransferase system IIA component